MTQQYSEADRINADSMLALKSRSIEVRQMWRWEDSTEKWFDRIIELLEIPDISSVFLDPQLQGGGKLFFREDGLVLEGVSFTAEQYDRLVNCIKDRFVLDRAIADDRLQEGFIKTEQGNYYWVGILNTLSGLQVTLIFRRSRESIENLSDRTKQVIEQMQKHPNGLMVFCHRPWSMSQQGIMFSVFDRIISQLKSDARIGCITESLQTYPLRENITQLYVDGSHQSWEKATRALVAQDIDVVMMRGRNQKEVVTQAILTALEDRFVLVDVSHLTAIDTLFWLLNELPVSASQVSSVLLGIVGSYPELRSVCPHCTITEQPDRSILQNLSALNISVDLNLKWIRGRGCVECHGTGYEPRQRLSVSEAIYIDNKLAKLCANQPTREALNIALAERNFRTYFEEALEFNQQKMTSVQEAIRVGLARNADL
ncbi:MAG: hypothetical protein ACRC11_21020 [Xenococcaceae cyanobacterium]